MEMTNSINSFRLCFSEAGIRIGCPTSYFLRTLIGDMKPLGAQDMAMEEGRQARIVFGAFFNVPCQVRIRCLLQYDPNLLSVETTPLRTRNRRYKNHSKCRAEVYSPALAPTLIALFQTSPGLAQTVSPDAVGAFQCICGNYLNNSPDSPGYSAIVGHAGAVGFGKNQHRTFHLYGRLGNRMVSRFPGRPVSLLWARYGRIWPDMRMQSC